MLCLVFLLESECFQNSFKVLSNSTLHEAYAEVLRGAIVTPLNSSLIENYSLISCEVIRQESVLLSKDTVNVSSQVRTIAYRMYRTPVQYSKHNICNVNNTPS